MRVADRREADAFGREVADRYDVGHEGLVVSDVTRREAAGKGWTKTKVERAALTAFIAMRRRQADAYIERTQR